MKAINFCCVTKRKTFPLEEPNPLYLPEQDNKDIRFSREPKVADELVFNNRMDLISCFDGGLRRLRRDLFFFF